MAYLLFVFGLGFLYLGAEWLVRGSSAAALRLGISPLVVGLTVVAFGTSSPELGVSLQAALDYKGDISLGNVIGSNICNIGLILGLAAIFRPLAIHRKIIHREIPFLLFVSLLLIFFLRDHTVARWEGGFFVTVLVVYLIIKVHLSRRERAKSEFIADKEYSIVKDAVLVIGGLVALVLGSIALVSGAVTIARDFGVSEAVIGLTIVAVGTSLPELATSVMAAQKKEGDIAVGNVIGSNIFNILAILGVSSLVHPIQSSDISQLDLFTMLFFAILILPMMVRRSILNRWHGGVLLLLFVGYMVILFVS